MSRPYQGYPYVDPPVQDAPTLNPAHATRWAHLPVRQVRPERVVLNVTEDYQTQQAKYSKKNGTPEVLTELPDRNENPVVGNRYPAYNKPKQNHRPSNTRKEKEEEDTSPVVYVDLPEEHNSPVVTNRYPAYDRPNLRPSNTRKEKKKEEEEDTPPVVYVDLPEEHNSPVVTNRYPAYDRPNLRPSNTRKEKKKEEEEDTPPVVYVDLPEEHNSPVVTNRYPAYDRPKQNQRPSNKIKEKERQEEEDAPPVVYVDLPEDHNSSVVTNRYPAYDRPTKIQRPSNKSKKKERQEEEDAPPVVYVDLPEEHNSSVVTSRPNLRPSNARKEKEKEEEEDTPPVVYVDLPDEHESAVAQRTTTQHRTGQSPGSSKESKRDPDEDPVVYIDIPERYGSDVTTRDATPQNEEPSFVQDTIYYDQFENRRIDEAKDQSGDSDDDTSSITAPPYRPAVLRPNTLALDGPGPSASHSSHTSPLPPSMMKEAQVYQPEAPMSSGLPDTIPVSEFPEPPPAYTEIDQVSNPVVPIEGERTRVILPGSASPDRPPIATPSTPTSLTSPNNGEVRKVMNCQHCGQRVQTLVIKENGIITHAVAVLCMLICFVPGVAFIYCTDYLKVTNYYCPICNGIIAYNLPFMKDKINIYTT